MGHLLADVMQRFWSYHIYTNLSSKSTASAFPARRTLPFAKLRTKNRLLMSYPLLNLPSLESADHLPAAEFRSFILLCCWQLWKRRNNINFRNETASLAQTLNTCASNNTSPHLVNHINTIKWGHISHSRCPSLKLQLHLGQTVGGHLSIMSTWTSASVGVLCRHQSEQ